MAVLGGGAVSYERSTPVWMRVFRTSPQMPEGVSMPLPKLRLGSYLRLIDLCITEL